MILDFQKNTNVEKNFAKYTLFETQLLIEVLFKNNLNLFSVLNVLLLSLASTKKGKSLDI